MKFMFSILCAFFLEILPLPLEAMHFRPEFLLILMIYWVLVMPYRIGLGAVWLVGLVADLLHGDLLGERALLMTFIVFLVIKLHARIRLFPLQQQMLAIFLLVLLFQCIQFLIFSILGHSLPTYLYWLASLTSALCWPLLPYLLGGYQQHRFNRPFI
jgi:rod shape-determining protein MreD